MSSLWNSFLCHSERSEESAIVDVAHIYVKCLRLLSATSLFLFLIIMVCGCAEPEEPSYNLKKRQEPSIAEKAGNSSNRATLAFSPDGRLVSVVGNFSIRLWDIYNSKPVSSLKTEDGSIKQLYTNNRYAATNSLKVGFTRDGIPFCGNYDRYYFWDKHSGDITRELTAPAYTTKNGGMIVHPTLLSKDASRQIISTDTNTNTIFEVKDAGTGKKKYSTITAEQRVSIDSTDCSQDGKYFIFRVNDAQLALVDTDTGHEVVRYSHEPIANSDSYMSYRTYSTRSFVSLSPDSQYAALYTTTTESPVNNSSQMGGQNGVTVDVASSISSLMIFSKDKTTPSFKPAFKGLILNVVFSRDNKTFAVLYNGQALVYDTKSLKVIHVLYSDNEPIMAIAFSPDSKKIATADGKSTLKIWDTKTGKEVLSLER